MNSDSQMGGLVSLPGNLTNPRNAKPSDWPDVASSGAAGSSSGDGQLVKQSEGQAAPARTQDSGDNTPSVWGKADWTVGKAKENSTAVKCDWSVNLESGEVSPDVRKYPA